MGIADHVDGGRLHDAGSRRSPHQERVDDLPEERRHLFDCGAGVLLHRVQPDVRRRGRHHWKVHVALRAQCRRTSAVGRRRKRSRCGGRQRLRRHVGLVFPDGVRRDGGVGGLWRDRRAHQDVVVLRVHRGADSVHLPGRGRVDLGRRLARPAGLPGLRRFDHRAQHRRLGGRGRRAGGGPPAG